MSDRKYVPELVVNLKISFTTEDGASYYATWAAELIATELNLSKKDVKVMVTEKAEEVSK